MLIAAERRAIVGFAGLEHLRRAELRHRERLERDHRVDRQLIGSDRTSAGQHEPVLRLPGREVREFPLLVVVAEKTLASVAQVQADDEASWAAAGAPTARAAITRIARPAG